MRVGLVHINFASQSIKWLINIEFQVHQHLLLAQLHHLLLRQQQLSKN
jgi:hypothetical protein